MNNTPLFIETICIHKQKVLLLDYHNARANKCRNEHFLPTKTLDFGGIINPQEAKTDLVKCRIIYGINIKSIEYHPYSIRPIKSLQLVNIEDEYQYKYKNKNREKLNHYFSQKAKADDIIMIQNGFVTDSYYTNLAFLKSGIWYTPSQPLLEGTKRASLIDQEVIYPLQIHKGEILKFESVRLFNAMIGFGEIEVDIDNVYF